MIAGVVPSPNIWNAPHTYELENLAVDRAGVIEDAMRSVQDWAGLDVLDVGCGTGFHLPRFAETARRVIGVEPQEPLVTTAQARVEGLPNARVLQGSAAATTLPAASIDVVHARWAYFFGPGCEPGLVELGRVMRRNGVAFVIDNDATRSTFGGWFREALPHYDPAAVERFWRRHGWCRERLEIRWTFDRRQDFEAVVRIEFPPTLAGRILEDDPERTAVDYAVNLRWRRF